jgi:hypothetical protein
VDITSPTSQAVNRLVHVSPSALDDEASVAAQDVVKLGHSSVQAIEQHAEKTYVLVTPYAGLAHGTDEVRAGEQHDVYIPMLPVHSLDSTEHGVDLVIEVIQDNSGALVGLESLPGVNHEPV